MKFEKNLQKIFTILNVHLILNVGKTYLIFYTVLQNFPLISTFQMLSSIMNFQLSSLSEICSYVSFFLRFFESNGVETFEFLFKNMLLILIIQALLLTVLVFFLKIDLQPKNAPCMNQNKWLIYITWIINALYLFKTPLIIILINFMRSELVFGSYLIAIIPFFLIIEILGVVFLLQQFRHSNNLINPLPNDNIYHQGQGFFHTFKTFIKAVITVTIWQVEEDETLMFLLFILLIINIIDLRSIIQSKLFLHPFTQKLKIMERIINLNTNLTIIMASFIENQTVKVNIILIIINISILLYESVNRYKIYKLKSIINGSKMANQENQAVFFMIQVIRTFKNQENRYFGISILHQHQEKCKNANCCCKTIDFNEKDKALREKLFNNFIKVILKDILSSNHRHSLLILSIYLNFQIVIMKSFTEIHPTIKEFLAHSKSLIQLGQRFILFQLQREVQNSLSKMSDCSFVELDIIFRQEETSKQLENYIAIINNKNIRKYTLLLQENCDLNIIQDICQQITENIRKIEKIWEIEQIQKSYNIKIFELYIIYGIYVLMSRESTSQYRSIMKNKLFTLHSVKGITLNNLSKYIYNKNCCIIQSKFDNSKGFGLISNVTSNCVEVFEMQRKMLINENIHSLMANFISTPHAKVSNQWLQEESISGSLKNIIRMIFVDKRGKSFFGNLYLKIHSNGSMLVFYAVIIKENHDDYLIINHQGVIQSFGSRIEKEGMLTAAYNQEKLSKICCFDLHQEMKDKEILKKRLIFKDSLSIIREISSNSLKHLQESSFSKAISNNMKEEHYFDCNTIVKREHIGDYSYFTITFLQISKIKRKKTHLSFFTFPQSPQFHEIWNTKLKQTKEEVLWQEASQNFQLCKVNEQNKVIGAETNSVNSSMNGNEVSVKIRKFYEQSKSKLKYIGNISDSCLAITTLVIISIIITSTLLLFFQNYLFTTSQSAFFENLNSYSSVSNNIIQIEVSFDHLMTINSYCSSQSISQQCQNLFINTMINNFQMYQQYVNHFSNFMQDIQYLSQNQYGYLNIQVQVLHCSQFQKETVKNLIEEIYYSYKMLLNNVRMNQIKNILYSAEIKFLLTNWPQIKGVHAKIQTFYDNIMASQMQTSFYIVFAVFGFLIISTFCIILAWWTCKKYFGDKRYNVCLLNAYISRKFCENYKKILVSLQFTNQARKQSYNFTQFSQFEQISTKPLKTVRYRRSYQYLYFLSAIFIILMVMNTCIVVSYATAIFNTPKIADSIKKIIKSSQKLMRQYVTLKQVNLQKLGTNTMNNFLKNERGITQPESQFSYNIKNSFSSIDKQFQQQYQNMLINSICNLTASEISNYAQEQCNQMKFRILDLGIMTAVDFVHIESNFNLVKRKRTSSQFSYPNYNTSIGLDIANYGYFMVKMFTLVERELISILETTINQQIRNVFTFQIMQTLMFLLILVVWISDIQNLKKSISDLYGQVIQLPKIIFKEVKSNIIHLQANLQFDF